MTYSVSFDTWFPNKTCRFANPQLRVVCFHNAGSTEAIFTNKGSSRRPSATPLLDFCKDNQVEFLACQLPGRGARQSEVRYTSALKACSGIFDALRVKLSDGVPYIFVAHSMGSLLAFELLYLLVENKIPLPKSVHLSSMLSPDTPQSQHPWKASRTLNDAQLKEECRGWDINDEVFEDDMWSQFKPLLKDDFQVFDEYKFDHPIDKFKCRAVIYHASKDKRITRQSMNGWVNFFKDVNFVDLPESNHAFVYDEVEKSKWQRMIISDIDSILLDLEYGG